MIPADRTNKQPLQFRCNNQECGKDGQPFEFTSTRDRCPKCKAEGYPYIQLLVLIHYLIPDDKGKISGYRGRRYRMACDPTRDYLATKTNEEAATSELAATTCPGCLKEANRLKGLVKPSGEKLTANCI
jgi:hypothetical protein